MLLFAPAMQEEATEHDYLMFHWANGDGGPKSNEYGSRYSLSLFSSMALMTAMQMPLMVDWLMFQQLEGIGCTKRQQKPAYSLQSKQQLEKRQ